MLDGVSLIGNGSRARMRVPPQRHMPRLHFGACATGIAAAARRMR